MLEIKGRIHHIHIKSEKSLQIIIQKRVKKKNVLVALEVWGYEKIKVDRLRLVKGDRIWANLFIKSKLYNGKWYSDVYIEDVERIEKKPRKNTDPLPGEQARIFYQR